MKLAIVLLLVIFGAKESSAQIQIRSNQYTYRYANPYRNNTIGGTSDTTGLRALINQDGAAQLWDFSHIAVSATIDSNSYRTVYLIAAPLKFDPDFVPSTQVFVSKDPDIDYASYTFEFISFYGLWTNGTSGESGGVASKLEAYHPPLQEFAFPLSYDTSWTSASKTYERDLPAGTVDSTFLTAVVDSYGTIVLPDENYYEALRLHRTYKHIFYQPGQAPTIGQTEEYDWLTVDGHTVRIEASADGTPIRMSYTLPGPVMSVATSPKRNDGGLSISVGGGIVAAHYTLEHSMPIRLTVSDVTGRVVETLADGPAGAGQHTSQLSTSTLPDGMYFVHLYGNGVSATQKMLVQR